MTPEDAQRLVHELPGWEQAIREPRAQLDYDPAWWNAAALDWTGTSPEPPFYAWFGRNRRLFAEATETAIRALGLSPLFAPNWRACFLSFRDGDLATVVEREPTLGTTGIRRAFPPIRSMLSVSVRSDPTGSILTITGPTAFVTDATLREASDRALRLTERAGEPEHPLLLLRRSRAGQIARRRVDPRRARALQLFAEDMPKAQILSRLQLEYEKPPAKSTVQDWLREAERFDRRP